MIEINPENLEWAFKKLKTYYYYYHSSLFLKKKIVDFEQKLHKNEINFEHLAQQLNSTNLQLSRINFLCYPKKESVKNYNGKIFIDEDDAKKASTLLELKDLFKNQGIFTMKLPKYITESQYRKTY